MRDDGGMLVLALVAAVGLLSVPLTRVEFRKLKPNVFRCARCGHEFMRPAHRDYPRTCPECGARDWMN